MRLTQDILPAGDAARRRPEFLLETADASARHLSPLTAMIGLIADHGDFVRYRTHYGRFLLVNRPELIRGALNSRDLIRNRLLKTVLGDGLLSSDGRHWEQQRRLMLPVFQPKQIEGMIETFRRVAEEHTSAWSAEPAGTIRDLTQDVFNIALSSVGQVLFAADFDSAFLEALDCIMREISAIQNAATFGLPLLRCAGGQRKYHQAMDTLESAIQPILARCRCKHAPLAPLLNVLAARYASGNEGPLSIGQIRDEILTMIIAGHETTAVALCWALRSIAAHPHVAKRLSAEVDRVIGNRPIQAADVPRLTYTRMLIDETLRLYPPVWIVARTAAKDTELCGTQIPKGTGVLISPFALHRDSRYWRHPLRFEPERFSVGATKPRPYTYLPFLAGRHQCLGKHFSLTEMVVVVAAIVQRYRLHLVDDRPLEFEPLVSLRMCGGLKLRVETRAHGRSRC